MTLGLALAGCGGMGLRHVYGLKELRDAGRATFRLIAVCDPVVDRAEHVAAAAEELLGRRPGVWMDFERMLAVPGLDAVDLVTDPATHHGLASLAFQAGKHVLVEKPLGVTVRAARAIVEANEGSGKTLAVAENYRRDPVNRMAKAVLDSGVLGDPLMVIQTCIFGGDRIASSVPWKHRKLEGGIPLEIGVHYADLLLQHVGDVDEVVAYAKIWEPTRRPRETPPRFYRHRAATETAAITATSEDSVFGLLRFRNGALGQLSLSAAGHGTAWRERNVLCRRGRLAVPAERTGRPITVTIEGEAPRTGDAALDLVPAYELDDLTSRLFHPRCTGYSMPSGLLNSKLVAIELDDFSEAIENGRPPEVDGMDGLKATALAYAFCESAYSGRPVSVRAVENGDVSAYQAEIDENLGLV